MRLYFASTVLLLLLANVGAESICQYSGTGHACDFNGADLSTFGEAREYLLHAHRQTYMGCFVDMGVRAMPDHYVAFHHTNTPSLCIAECESQGYKYAGMQWSYECFCSDSYDKYGSAPESDCYKPCEGDSNFQCGGGWRNSVWATKQAEDLIQIQLESRDSGFVARVDIAWGENQLTFLQGSSEVVVWRNGELTHSNLRDEDQLDIDGVQIKGLSSSGWQPRFEVRLHSSDQVLAELWGPEEHALEWDVYVYKIVDGWGMCYDANGENTPGEGGNPPSLFGYH